MDYANAHDAVILYDSAYEAFITEPDIPHSIFEIPGAETCAIEFRSFSKSAGFTGNRCAYTVIPKALVRGGASLNAMWNRRQGTKFNGVPYVIQRAAEAALSPEGRAQSMEAVRYYLRNAQIIRAGLEAGRTDGLRRRQRAVYLVPHPGGLWLLGILRPPAPRGLCGHHARRGLRPQRRGLHPRDRLRH